MRKIYPRARRSPLNGAYGDRYKFTIPELPYARGWYWCCTLIGHMKMVRRRGDYWSRRSLITVI